MVNTSAKIQSFPSRSSLVSICAAIAVRAILVASGRIADVLFEVRYTDVDYDVFTDGARHVLEGKSPYDRATFRYVPILAWLLVPNVTLFAEWGKVLFSICDMAIGSLLWSILVRHMHVPRDQAVRWVCGCFLLNPFTVNISTRGNADALVVMCVVGALWLLLERRLALAGAVYGLAVHLKLYPVIHALPIGLWLLQPQATGERTKAVHQSRSGQHDDGTGAKLADSAGSSEGVSVLRWLREARYGDLLRFVVPAAGTLGWLTAASYVAYGDEFLRHAVLYHVGRADPRHNFSPAFLPIYYSLAAQQQGGAAHAYVSGGQGDGWSDALFRLLISATWAPLWTFVPQMGLVAFLGWRYHSAHLPLALFAQTFAFVHWNKVVTAQYFCWYLALLPLVAPLCRLPARAWAALAGAWCAAELAWSWPALHLELRSQSVHAWVWGGSMAFFAVNVGVLAVLLASVSTGRGPASAVRAVSSCRATNDGTQLLMATAPAHMQLQLALRPRPRPVPVESKKKR